MALLQVFQAKFFHCMDESSPDPAAFRELHSVTDLVLCATTMTAQATGRSMPKRHLWLTLTKIKDVENVPFLDTLVFPTGLFGPEVEGFAECFTATQKTSCQSAPVIQLLPVNSRWCSLSNPRSPHHQQLSQLLNLSHVIALAWPDAIHFQSAKDLGPSAGVSLQLTTPQAASVMPPSAPFSSGCQWHCVCSKHRCELWASSNSAHTTDCSCSKEK